MPGSLRSEALNIIIKLAMDAYRDGIVQRDHDDPRPPRAVGHRPTARRNGRAVSSVTSTLIRLNGVGEQGHETFRFDTEERDRFGCFCKTVMKPYDEVVMRLLLVLAYYRPGMEVRSDGYFAQEWTRALIWFNETVGCAYARDRLVFERPQAGIMIEPGMIAG